MLLIWYCQFNLLATWKPNNLTVLKTLSCFKESTVCWLLSALQWRQFADNQTVSAVFEHQRLKRIQIVLARTHTIYCSVSHFGVFIPNGMLFNVMLNNDSNNFLHLRRGLIYVVTFLQLVNFQKTGLTIRTKLFRNIYFYFSQRPTFDILVQLRLFVQFKVCLTCLMNMCSVCN